MYNFSKEEIKMIKQKLSGIECLFKDTELEPLGYCQKECATCENKMTVKKWLDCKKVHVGYMTTKEQVKELNDKIAYMQLDYGTRAEKGLIDNKFRISRSDRACYDCGVNVKLENIAMDSVIIKNAAKLKISRCEDCAIKTLKEMGANL